MQADERRELLDRFSAALASVDVVVLSDYGKGMLLDGMAAELIAMARQRASRSLSIRRAATSRAMPVQPP